MRMHRDTARTRRGFTILELLIVIVMVSALAAVSMGRTSRILAGWRVNRAAQAMSEELQKGFALVGRNRKPVIIRFNKGTMILSIRARTDTVYSRRSFGKESEYNLDSADVTLATSSVKPVTLDLEVFPPGLAADSLSIIIKKPGAARRIRMLRGGLVQVCSTGDATKC